MDSDSMRNFLFSSSGDLNYGAMSGQVGSSLIANNGGQMMEQNDASCSYPLLLGQYYTQQQQQQMQQQQHQQEQMQQQQMQQQQMQLQQMQQDFSSPQYGAGQMFGNSMGFGNMRGEMNMNQNFSSFGNMGMQQSVVNSYGTMPQAIAATPTSSQSDLSTSDRMFSLSGMNGFANASFMCNTSPAQSNTSVVNPFQSNTVRDPYAEQGILGPWSERSAGLLGKLVCSDPANAQGKVKRARRKQPKDKPKRPLSAYNIFFKEERARLLSKAPSEAAESGVQKRTANGKIGFESLAKIIGGKWQDLKPSEVEYYKEKAGADMQRYKSEMEEYNKKMAGKISPVDDEEGDDESGGSKKQRLE